MHVSSSSFPLPHIEHVAFFLSMTAPLIFKIALHRVVFMPLVGLPFSGKRGHCLVISVSPPNAFSWPTFAFQNVVYTWDDDDCLMVRFDLLIYLFSFLFIVLFTIIFTLLKHIITLFYLIVKGGFFFIIYDWVFLFYFLNVKFL